MNKFPDWTLVCINAVVCWALVSPVELIKIFAATSFIPATVVIERSFEGL